jgi:hypothetical protein
MRHCTSERELDFESKAAGFLKVPTALTKSSPLLVCSSFSHMRISQSAGGTGLINHLDRYDLLREDIEWLQLHNATAEQRRPPLPQMNEEDMERLIELFEKEAGKITMVRAHSLLESVTVQN